MTLTDNAALQQVVDEAVATSETDQAAPPELEFLDEKVLKGPFMRLVKVTPSVAVYWLTKNTRNRPVNMTVVREYALAMKENRWHFDGDPYQISVTGEVLNAQHRLMAQVASNTTLVVPVWFDIDPDAQLEMDQGRKRSFASNLYLRDPRAKKDSSLLAPVISMAYYWDRGARGRELTNFHGPSAQQRQLDEYWKEHADELLFALPAAKAAHRGGHAPTRVTGFANVLFRRLDVVDADAFMQSLSDGVGLELENPILLLRQRLINEYSNKHKIGRLEAWVTLALMIKTWNYWRDGVSIRTLSFKPGGAGKEMFPEPH